MTKQMSAKFGIALRELYSFKKLYGMLLTIFFEESLGLARSFSTHCLLALASLGDAARR